jgi:flagellar hook-length control protein FliK
MTVAMITSSRPVATPAGESPAGEPSADAGGFADLMAAVAASLGSVSVQPFSAPAKATPSPVGEDKPKDAAESDTDAGNLMSAMFATLGAMIPVAPVAVSAGVPSLSPESTAVSNVGPRATATDPAMAGTIPAESTTAGPPVAGGLTDTAAAALLTLSSPDPSAPVMTPAEHAAALSEQVKTALAPLAPKLATSAASAHEANTTVEAEPGSEPTIAGSASRKPAAAASASSRAGAALSKTPASDTPATTPTAPADSATAQPTQPQGPPARSAAELGTAAVGAAPVAAPTARVPQSAPAAAAGSTGAAATPEPPSSQVLSVLRPVKRFSDGSHRLSIQLRPDDLGTVTVELAVHHGRLDLHMVADSAAATDSLRSSLHELRSEFEASGQRTGSFDVSQHGDRQHQPGRTIEPGTRDSQTGSGAFGGQVPTTAAALPALVAAALDSSAGRLDLRI